MKRLLIIAEHGHDPEKQSLEALAKRGQHLFGDQEADLVHSAYFLVLLLDFMESWAHLYDM